MNKFKELLEFMYPDGNIPEEDMAQLMKFSDSVGRAIDEMEAIAKKNPDLKFETSEDAQDWARKIFNAKLHN